MLLNSSLLIVLLILLCIAGNAHPPEDNHVQEATVVQDLEELLSDGGHGRECWDRIQSLPVRLRESHMVEFLAARSLAQLGNLHHSERSLRRLLSTEELSKDLQIKASKLLTNLYLPQQRWVEAQQLLDVIHRLDPSDDEALLSSARIALGKDRDKQKALQLIDMAIQLNPNNERAYFDRAVVMLEIGEKKNAHASFAEAKRLNPSLDQGIVSNLYVQFGHFDLAEQELENVLRYKADNRLLLLLAQTKEFLGKVHPAKDLYIQVIASEPNNAAAHAGIGLLLLGIGNHNYGAQFACGLNQEEALSHLRIAIRFDPDLVSVTDALANCKQEFEETHKWRNITKSMKNHVNTLQPSIILNFVQQLVRPMQRFKRQLHTGLAKLLSAPCAKMELPLLSSLCQSMLTSPESDMVYQQFPPKVAKKILKMQKNWRIRSKTIRNSVHDVSWPGIKVFYQKFVKTNTPVIIRGFQSPWTHSNFTNSDMFLRYLQKSFGKSIVKVSISPTGRFDGPEAGRLWGQGDKTEVLVRPATTSMLFGDFLFMAKSNVDETLYLQYQALHQHLGEEFEQLFPLPFNHQVVGMKRLVAQAWISGSPTISPLHYDDTENFFCQIYGEKEFILFPPGDLPYLYYQRRLTASLAYEFPNKFHRDVESVEKRAVLFGSSMLLDQPDETRHPLYRYATPIRVILQPRECLYLPSFWHHEVQSVPDPITKVNFAVNFCFQNVSYPVDERSIFNI